MSSELSFVLITPYSLMKSRTGGILARLLSRTDLELVGAQMLTPSHDLVRSYADSIKEYVGRRDEFAARLFSDYMLDNFSPLLTGERERVLMLLFRGENACEKLSGVVGPIPHAKNRRTPDFRRNRPGYLCRSGFQPRWFSELFRACSFYSAGKRSL